MKNNLKKTCECQKSAAPIVMPVPCLTMREQHESLKASVGEIDTPELTHEEEEAAIKANVRKPV